MGINYESDYDKKPSKNKIKENEKKQKNCFLNQ